MHLQSLQVYTCKNLAVLPALCIHLHGSQKGTTQATQYFYNKNGHNLVKDLNKGINDIQYNSLNLPGRLSISGSQGSATNTYLYSADGRKLNMTAKWGTSSSKNTDYVGNIIYENGSLKRILVNGGYVEGGIYHFYLTDHLGNNRVVAKADGTIVQSTHYYPFGMSFADGITTSSQPYKFGNKELDTDQGLNWYDFSARFKTVDILAFTTMDPLAEKYYSISPYAYCKNNPINRVDPTGLEDLEDDYFNQNGKYLGTDNAQYYDTDDPRYSDKVRVMHDSQWEYNSNGDGTIDPEIGTSIGKLHSESTISTEGSLEIYQHYNSTGIPLANATPGTFDANSTGMITQSLGGINPIRIDVDVAGFKRTKISDHSNEIRNTFSHEEKHVGDMKVMGYNLKGSPSDRMGEARAIQAQMSHPSYSKTRPEFKAGIAGYAEKLKLQPFVLPSIQKPFK